MGAVWIYSEGVDVCGGGVYLVRCVMLSLSPHVQILECVAINLTFVYALHAYAHITHTNLSSIIVRTLLPNKCCCQYNLQ